MPTAVPSRYSVWLPVLAESTARCHLPSLTAVAEVITSAAKELENPPFSFPSEPMYSEG